MTKTVYKYRPDPYVNAWNDWQGNRKSLIQITRDEWIQWWKDTGVFEQRGSHIGAYRMARIDISKPFTLDNITLTQNLPSKKRINKHSGKHSAPQTTVVTQGPQ